ncbi:unnamed protein product [Onchocerca ochengi]|uniref:Uncharacterized protein n=1 Tax=Onchocerca ochengi TaxID=42157 RepID=A0A182EL03_ONCOC|nr:unnamed protein product [Onchocerca ochengi]
MNNQECNGESGSYKGNENLEDEGISNRSSEVVNNEMRAITEEFSTIGFYATGINKVVHDLCRPILGYA